MAKELIIVFLYDTQIHLKEEDDPQKAVVYFHPSWVSRNQRMALCGQLIGVTQFLQSNFSFPRVLALKYGKFVVRKFGRYMLCVGTDRNIPDWVLEKRAVVLHRTMTFFHNNLSNVTNTKEAGDFQEDLNRLFEIYLPVLLYAGNIFVNAPTIRLPKSASSIFLEAAQILECLQDKSGVHGGAIFYQNKVVMSQLGTDITKQLVMTDPYRVKLPAEYVPTSFHLPVGIQLMIVYVDEDEIAQLAKDGLPSKSFIKSKFSKTQSLSNYNTAVKRTQSRIFTVMEEETEHDRSPLKLANMPDLVRDTMKMSAETKKHDLDNVNISSRIVDDCPFPANVSHSADNLGNNDLSPIRYYSLGLSHMVTKLSSSHSSLLVDSVNNYASSSINATERKSFRKNHLPNLNLYYNTISDPVFPWFRYNGLPASKALLDDRISAYYKSIDVDTNKMEPFEPGVQEKESEETKLDDVDKNAQHQPLVRPTSISLSGQGMSSKKAKIRKALNLDLKNNIPGVGAVIDDCKGNDIPLTPLMAKLKSLELDDNDKTSFVTPVLPSTSETKENDVKLSCQIPDTVENAIEHQSYNNNSNNNNKYLHAGRRRKKKTQLKFQQHESSELKRYVLYVFGQQNISIYLILNEEVSKDPDLIHFLWKTCFNCVSDLERHFLQYFEPIPQTQGLDSWSADAYSYVNIHSAWETLQKGGAWTTSQLDMLSTLHNDFNNAGNITDITLRTENAVTYGSQLGDNQVFYQQPATDIAGLPMPSDLMGVVPLKAKRRLERDHGILLI